MLVFGVKSRADLHTWQDKAAIIGAMRQEIPIVWLHVYIKYHPLLVATTTKATFSQQHDCTVVPRLIVCTS